MRAVIEALVGAAGLVQGAAQASRTRGASG